MKIIVDTSILIDNLRGGDKWNKFQEKVDEDSEIFLPTIVVFELFLGGILQRDLPKFTEVKQRILKLQIVL